MPRSRRLAHRFAGVEHGSEHLQVLLKRSCERMRATVHAPRGPFRVLERIDGLAGIVERRTGVREERVSKTGLRSRATRRGP